MAASPTPRPTPAEINPALPPLSKLACALPVGIAFSGGADSTALLLAAVEQWPGQVHAIHVHHGLQAAADHFERHCRQVCDELRIPFDSVRVNAAHSRGESPEDAARRARYAALARAARDAGLKTVLLGQHADDQVETMLLALSRGAGLAGLAAMPTSFERDGMRFERPLLGVSGAAIRQWLAEREQGFIDDPTNADVAFTRNRIRHEVLPVLERAFPQFRETFARSARHAAQAQELLTSLALEDLAGMGGQPRIAALQQLPRARQGNLLRQWLRVEHGVASSTAQLEELLDQIGDCRTRGHRLRIKVSNGFVERRGELLVYLA